MPKSDTWPGGLGLEPVSGMDSAGSCDSVVSANSGFSDDSMEFLSAEEKACLMFLEETIDSLDTEDDSGLSNDESDQLPHPGNLANRLADLTASMGKGSQILAEPIKADSKPKQSYLVPTPFVMARCVPGAKPAVPLKPHLHSSNDACGLQQNQKPPVPLEVNVVIPPPTKPRDHSARTTEPLLPRGPLSYDALVHLRRSASTKKTPLCPMVDHTIDSNKNPPVPNLGRPSYRSHTEVSTAKKPTVPPKPQKIPNEVSMKIQNQAPLTPDSLYSAKNATDPNVVRLEALQKLGLLKDPEPEEESMAPLPPKSHGSLDPAAVNRFGKAPCHPARSPSFCYSQVPTEAKGKLLQTSASFHHCSRSEQHTKLPDLVPAPVHSTTVDRQMNGRPAPAPQGLTAAEPQKSAAQSGPHRPPNVVGYTVMVVPGMGADRKEALRKLGLLKTN